ncbi:MAG: hypothetical protein JO352_25520 [Chloroflexi bacterium]|nr:hypothetical protein [Chloroflexota bacterium]
MFTLLTGVIRVVLAYVIAFTVTEVIGRNVATQTPAFSLLSPVARFTFHTLSFAVNSRPVWNWTLSAT